jgi:TRAP-type mannitol/chloroaromatic compound transport system permease small subunit
MLSSRLLRLCHLIDGINALIARTVAWMALLMVLVAFCVVLLRYAFDLGWIGMQESVTYLHAMVFMLGAAFTLRSDGHVRVDVFYRRFGPRGQALVNLLGSILLLLPVAGFILWTSWDYVAESWSLRESSREAGGLPWVYLLKSLIPLMAGLLILQGLAEILRNGLRLLGVQAPEETPD